MFWKYFYQIVVSVYPDSWSNFRFLDDHLFYLITSRYRRPIFFPHPVQCTMYRTMTVTLTCFCQIPSKQVIHSNTSLIHCVACAWNSISIINMYINVHVTNYYDTTWLLHVYSTLVILYLITFKIWFIFELTVYAIYLLIYLPTTCEVGSAKI